MNKDEMLEENKNDQTNVELIETENKGRTIGMAAISCIFVIVVIVNLLSGKDSYGPMSMFWAYAAAEAYSKHQSTKRKVFLVITVIGAIASLLYLVCFLLSVLR